MDKHRGRPDGLSTAVDPTARGMAGPDPAAEPWATPPLQPVRGVGEILLVASGKGGVGKSTVAVNLASVLQRMGLATGVLDADLFGPSVARLLGTGESLALDEDGRAVPAASHGIHSVSAANILPPEAALAWKGPLVAQAVVQMFRDVAWPDLDLLLVDLPPGTGDVQLTILEQVPVTGAVVVTTPERLATVDAERAIALFHDHDVPVFGLIETMAEYLCPCCGERQSLFGPSDARRTARDSHVAYLGGVPADLDAQAAADGGVPLTVARPAGATAAAFCDIGAKVMAALAREQRARAKAARAEAASAGQSLWDRLLDD